MANYLNGVMLPSVSEDYYCSGNGKQREKYETREARFERAARDVFKAFREEMGTELTEKKGIVNVSIGKYPYDLEISVNSPLTRWGADLSVNYEKPFSLKYMYENRTYIMKGKRLKEILTSNSVLLYGSCVAAVAAIREYYGWRSTESLGACFIAIKKGNHPCRVWRVETEDGFRYLVMSLLNGMVFNLTPEDMPDMAELPAKFFFRNAVQFIQHENGDWERK